MKIPYFIASVLLTGNHLNTDYLLGRQLMHISKKQLDRQREKTLQILDRIFSATLFLALQVISFRGHRHKDLMTTFGNSGNCLEIKLIARHDPVMASHLASKKSRSKYTSPQIQNEIIDSIARVIREKIISEILVAKYFCVILDTTPDIAHMH